MNHKEKFENLGIQPPKGVLMYGPPGTGKTLLARACAAQTKVSALGGMRKKWAEAKTFPNGPRETSLGACGLTRITVPPPQATFLKLAGPQLVQMFIGDGAKLVRDAFALAKEKAPSIIFIDELDAIGTKR